MGIYDTLRKEFTFLLSVYGFVVCMSQRRGSYHYILYTNGKRKIMVLYDDTVDQRIESPLQVRVYNADCLGTAYDNVDEHRLEFFNPNWTPKERIHYAALWLQDAIERKTVVVDP